MDLWIISILQVLFWQWWFAGYFLRTSYKINNDWNTWVHFHYFASAGNINDVSDPGNAADPYFGTEVDWVLNYRFDQTTQLQFRAATMLGSSTLQQVKGQPATDGGMGFFSYLQFQFTPKIPVTILMQNTRRPVGRLFFVGKLFKPPQALLWLVHFLLILQHATIP